MKIPIRKKGWEWGKVISKLAAKTSGFTYFPRQYGRAYSGLTCLLTCVTAAPPPDIFRKGGYCKQRKSATLQNTLQLFNFVSEIHCISTLLNLHLIYRTFISIY